MLSTRGPVVVISRPNSHRGLSLNQGSLLVLIVQRRWTVLSTYFALFLLTPCCRLILRQLNVQLSQSTQRSKMSHIQLVFYVNSSGRSSPGRPIKGQGTPSRCPPSPPPPTQFRVVVLVVCLISLNCNMMTTVEAGFKQDWWRYASNHMFDYSSFARGVTKT